MSTVVDSCGCEAAGLVATGRVAGGFGVLVCSLGAATVNVTTKHATVAAVTNSFIDIFIISSARPGGCVLPGGACQSPFFSGGAGASICGVWDGASGVPRLGAETVSEPELVWKSEDDETVVLTNEGQQNVVVENLTADPAAPVSGQIWLRSDL